MENKPYDELAIKVYGPDIIKHRPGEIPSLGTTWVAPGEGSTWRELHDAIDGVWSDWNRKAACNLRLASGVAHSAVPRSYTDTKRTNLKLTGCPIQPYDRDRWESGNVS